MSRLSLLPVIVGLLAFILSLTLFHFIASPYPILGALVTSYFLLEITCLIQFQQQKNQAQTSRVMVLESGYSLGGVILVL